MKINIKNKTEVNKIVRFISKDKSSKINIDNLINPTLSLKTSEENGDSLSFCLAPEDCIPLVDKVSCLCLDLTKTYKVIVDVPPPM